MDFYDRAVEIMREEGLASELGVLFSWLAEKRKLSTEWMKAYFDKLISEGRWEEINKYTAKWKDEIIRKKLSEISILRYYYEACNLMKSEGMEDFHYSSDENNPEAQFNGIIAVSIIATGRGGAINFLRGLEDFNKMKAKIYVDRLIDSIL